MKLEHIYRSSLAVSALLYVLYWFGGYAYWLLDPQVGNVLSYTGFGAWFEFPDWWEWWPWLYLGVVVAGYIGMFLYRKLFLWVFLATIIADLLLSPALGLSVITGIEVLLVDASTFLQGFVVALAVFTPLKEKFY